MIRFVALTMGYVESSTVTSLLLENHSGIPFENAKDALKHLASGLFQKYLWDNSLNLEPTQYPRECCKTFLAKKRVPKFCGDCGSRLVAAVIHQGDFVHWIYDLTAQSADGFGEDLPGWWPWVSLAELVGLNPGELVVINENSEKLLVALLEPEMVPEEYRKTIEEWRKDSEFQVNIDKLIGEQ